ELTRLFFLRRVFRSLSQLGNSRVASRVPTHFTLVTRSAEATAGKLVPLRLRSRRRSRASPWRQRRPWTQLCTILPASVNTAVAISAPDDHPAPGPHCGVAPSTIGHVDSARGDPTVWAGV